MRVQVNILEDTTTGQAATFALFGDTTLTNATPPGSQPAVKSDPPPACSATTNRLSNLRNAPQNGAQSEKVLGAGANPYINGRPAHGSGVLAHHNPKQTSSGVART